MERTIARLMSLLSKGLSATLPPDVNPSIKFVLQKTEATVRETLSADEYRKALYDIQSVLDITWEQLNTGHWSNVPIHLRYVYTAASFLKILAQLQYQKASCDTSKSDSDALKSCLKCADVGLLLGAPLPLTTGLCLTEAAGILSDALSEQAEESESPLPGVSDGRVVLETVPSGCVRGRTIPRLKRPSLEKFKAEHFDTQTPVILTDCIGHWPALTRWTDSAYLRRVAGARTVPVEIGAKYTDESWSQKLMTVSDFIDVHVRGTASDAGVGYLAQHPLFDQVPELLSDIREPEYCCVSDSSDEPEEPTAINAWFGPAGTVSPLHFDPKHNLLAQVVGSKHVYLYAPSESRLLYPHEGRLLANTARVDPESPDYEAFPRYREANAWRCRLDAGDVLYIPPEWWHHVRSLTTSFSVSFWWR